MAEEQHEVKDISIEEREIFQLSSSNYWEKHAFVDKHSYMSIKEFEDGKINIITMTCPVFTYSNFHLLPTFLEQMQQPKVVDVIISKNTVVPAQNMRLRMVKEFEFISEVLKKQIKEETEINKLKQRMEDWHQLLTEANIENHNEVLEKYQKVSTWMLKYYHWILPQFRLEQHSVRLDPHSQEAMDDDENSEGQ